jgi:hypothetical protein
MGRFQFLLFNVNNRAEASQKPYYVSATSAKANYIYERMCCFIYPNLQLSYKFLSPIIQGNEFPIHSR